MDATLILLSSWFIFSAVHMSDINLLCNFHSLLVLRIINCLIVMLFC